MASETRSSPGLLAYSLQVASVAQAAVAIPVAVVLGSTTFDILFNTYVVIRVYYFITALLNCLMAAGIVFIVIVQLKVPVTAFLTLVSESAKSTLATLMWLWLILDAAFAPHDGFSWQPQPDKDARRRYMIIRAALTSIVLFVLFYPTLAIAVYVHQHAESDTTDANEVLDEHTPLLAEDV